MAESKRRHGKLKGVVLVMVVTIMFVLMIMLLATLAVVSSTTKRTYNKYEENQAYYTSRSVLEVFIKNYLEDKTNLGEAGTTSPTTALSEVCGTLLPKHFTDVVDYTRSTTDPSDPGLNAGSYYVDFAGAQATNGFYFQQQIFGNLYPKYEWKFDEQGNPNGAMLFSDDKYWEMRADVSTDNAASIAAKPYSVEFEVSLPELTGTGDSDAGLFANRKDGTGTQTSKIKVELLRVMFVTEDMSQWTDFMKSGTDVGSSTTAGGKIDFKTVNWDKTYYRLKVSATTNLGTGDEESDITVSVILEPTQKATTPMGGPENAMTSFDATSADNKLAVVGGAALSKPGGTTEFNNDGTSLVGNIVYNSNFRIVATSSKWAYGEGESMVVHGGWLSMSNRDFVIDGDGPLNTSDASVLSTRPFIFAQGAKFYKAKVGSDTEASGSGALDIICGDPKNTGTDKAFKDEAGLTGANVPDDHKEKVAFVTSEANNKFYGDVYVDGDMYLGGNGDEFFGNIYCTGNIYIAYDNSGQGPKFHKEVHCNDVYSGSNVASNKASFLSGGTYETASSFTIKWNDDNIIKDGDHAGQMQFTLPRRGDVYCGTSTEVKSAYTYKALGIAPTGGKSENDVVRAQDYFRYAVGDENAKLDISAAAKNVTGSYTGTISDSYGVYTGKILDTSGAPKSDAGFAQCKLSLANYGNDVYYINATADPIQIQLTTDSFGNMTAHSPTFIVVGDKSVVFTLADNTDFYAGSMAVYNSQIYSMITGSQKMYVGSNYPSAHKGSPAAPQIQYFIGDNSKFNFSNPGNFALCGYIYGGYASLEFGSQTNGDAMHRANLNYNGKDMGTRDHCSFFGSAVFHSIKFQQIETMVFIDPNNKDKSGGSNAGGRIVWGRQRYLNRN